MTNDTRPPVAPIEAEWDKLDQLMLAYEEAGEGNSVDSVIHAYSAMFSKKQVLRARMIEWEQRLARLEALIPIADAACDYADQHCRWFDISTAPWLQDVDGDYEYHPPSGHDVNVGGIGQVYKTDLYDEAEGVSLPDVHVGDVFYKNVDPVTLRPLYWRPPSPPPLNPPLPAVFTELGQALEKIKGAG